MKSDCVPGAVLTVVRALLLAALLLGCAPAPTAVCPRTLPDGGALGNGVIATNIQREYALIQSNGKLAVRMPWYRSGSGPLTVQVRRLNDGALGHAEMSDTDTVDGFVGSGVFFPGPGC